MHVKTNKGHFFSTQSQLCKLKTNNVVRTSAQKGEPARKEIVRECLYLAARFKKKKQQKLSTPTHCPFKAKHYYIITRLFRLCSSGGPAVMWSKGQVIFPCCLHVIVSLAKALNPNLPPMLLHQCASAGVNSYCSCVKSVTGASVWMFEDGEMLTCSVMSSAYVARLDKKKFKVFETDFF